ncbi:hypothetical protein DFQ27_007281 [Actinomortierella ambigua]|uniref:Uncharacterized protein n=1 Tax=Actinomortierella ambigua TaxID=1343610 RepID=A0A9P6PWK9_9FUNG|nr:hypothetical protein DFQ27_007281 [Actinomortierella ambigua]
MGRNVAAYDLDSTLIKVNGKHKWPKNADDWVWWNASVPARLKEEHEKGHILVVITNQAGLTDQYGNIRAEKQKEMKLKFEKICAQLQLPMWILISMAKDHYRKPMTGLWHWLERKFEANGVEIDRATAFYVGDAAGRHAGWMSGVKEDFNNTDRKFAASLHIAFDTPEHYFLKQACPDHLWSFGEFDPKNVPSEGPLFTPTSTPLIPTDNTCELILFVGPPASGKSSFAAKHILHLDRYEYVNQDTLKTRDRCLKAVEESLKESKSVVVDNTNADEATRALYIAIAKKYNLPVRCFLFTASRELVVHNNHFRAFHRPLISAMQGESGEAQPTMKVKTSVTTSTGKSSTSIATEQSANSPIGNSESPTGGLDSVSTTTTSTSTTTSVIKVRDEPVRERLSEMVFATYYRKYQEPKLEEGFTEIKKINFLVDEDIRDAWTRWYV